MRIGNDFTSIHSQKMTPTTDAKSAGFVNRQPDSEVTVNISPEGWEAYRRGSAASEGSKSIAKSLGLQECQTCKNRSYKDVSNDPSVSFQTPTHISPGQSAAAVSSHENEHVSNERAKAEQGGREIISQTVTLKTSICPECKRVYVSGGVTNTLSRPKEQAKNVINELI
jgi:hypothetical protein